MIEFIDWFKGKIEPVTHRVLVTGSRNWNEPLKVIGVLYFIEQLWKDYWPLTLVHGACPTGLDLIVDQHARSRPARWVVETHPAQWGLYGMAAGPRRNQEMVDMGADVGLAWMRLGSRGT